MKKNHLKEAYERENAYLAEQEVGSEEYKASLQRLMAIKEAMNNPGNKKWIVETSIEGVKVVSGVVLPLIGLVWITATEKDVTFTGALREYTKYFFPKKN